MLAPIILFTYNRKWHTQQTLEALRHNELAEQSDLIIFSDAAKDERDEHKVEAVREYLKNIDGFKSIRIIERNQNWGLARSIMEGVTEVINHYGKVIVLEDDIVTSPAFLRFMNQALDYYKDEPKVWHISGWSYPIQHSGFEDVFFWRVMNCWGWATWKDSWLSFEKSPKKLIESWTSRQKKQFDLDNSGIFWPQVESNLSGKIDTWAIFWYATIFQNNGLCLNPTLSYVTNIGHDGTGVNCGETVLEQSIILNSSTSPTFTNSPEESEEAVCCVKKYYQRNRKSIYVRILNKLSRLLIKRNII